MTDDDVNNAAPSKPAPNIQNEYTQQTQDSNMTCDEDLNNTCTEMEKNHANLLNSTNSPPDRYDTNTYLTQPFHLSSPPRPTNPPYTFNQHTTTTNINTNPSPRGTLTLGSPEHFVKFGRGQFRRRPDFFNNTRLISETNNISTKVTNQNIDDSSATATPNSTMDTDSEVSHKKNTHRTAPNNNTSKTVSQTLQHLPLQRTIDSKCTKDSQNVVSVTTTVTNSNTDITKHTNTHHTDINTKSNISKQDNTPSQSQTDHDDQNESMHDVFNELTQDEIKWLDEDAQLRQTNNDGWSTSKSKPSSQTITNSVTTNTTKNNNLYTVLPVYDSENEDNIPTNENNSTHTVLSTSSKEAHDNRNVAFPSFLNTFINKSKYTPPRPNKPTTGSSRQHQQNTPSSDTSVSTPIAKTSNSKQTPVNTENNYHIYMKVSAKQSEASFSRLNVIQIILEAFQDADPSTILVIPSTTYQQERTFTNIDPTHTNRHMYDQLEQQLYTTTSGHICGTLLFNSTISYSKIKKNASTRRKLQSTFKYFIVLNTIQASHPTEVGILIHHLVRYDTISSDYYLKSVLPSNTPPFQQDLTTFWTTQRQGVGILKIFTDLHNVNEVSKSFRQTFNKIQTKTFIDRDFFSSLDQVEKMKYIESQLAYQNKYRTLLIEGITNIKIPTTHQDQNNRSMTISEWILQVHDLQHQQLFTHVTQVKHNTIELQFLNIKFSTALKWAKNALTHIARVVDPTYLQAVFNDPEYTYHDLQTSDKWEPPTPPRHTFLPTPTTAWKNIIPKNITSSTMSKTDIKKQKKYINTREEDDQLTITTAATQMSYSQDAISDLQSDSRQHSISIEAHSERFQRLEELVNNRIQQVKTTVDLIRKEQNSQINQQTQLATQIESLSATLPTITEQLQLQHEQHNNHMLQQNSVNDTTSQVLERLQIIQQEQQNTISRLEHTIQAIQHHQLATPESVQRHRRKRRTTQSNTTNLQPYEQSNNDSIMLFEGTTNDISVIINNNQSQDNASQTDATSNNTESDNSDSKMSAKSTNKTLNTLTKDLDDYYPGKDT
jgi:hypothetical protein